MTEAGNAYNPVPSPDGQKIAFVRLGWGREGGSGGFGASNLSTSIMVMDANGKLLSDKALADYYLSGWSRDGKRLVCFRDWEYALVALDGSIPQVMPQVGDDHRLKSLHCGYLPKSDLFIWVRSVVKESHGSPGGTVTTLFSGCRIESRNGIIAESSNMLDYLIPSPDERYIAAFRDLGMYPRKMMWVLDLQTKTWAEIGELTVEPCRGWSDAWTPWFPDGTRMAIADGKEITIRTPDGKVQGTLASMNATTGMPTVSRDGKWVAFVTWSGTEEASPGTTVYIVSSQPGAQPRAVTSRAPGYTQGLKWLNDSELVLARSLGPRDGGAPPFGLFKIRILWE